jgi:hypothetical protein
MTSKILLTSLAAATAALMAFTVAPAGAVSPSEQQCVNSGGTFTREKGTVSCTSSSTTNTGASEKSQTITITEEESSKGTLKNEPQHEESSSCDGPGKSGESSAHCN